MEKGIKEKVKRLLAGDGTGGVEGVRSGEEGKRRLEVREVEKY